MSIFGVVNRIFRPDIQHLSRCPMQAICSATEYQTQPRSIPSAHALLQRPKSKLLIVRQWAQAMKTGMECITIPSEDSVVPSRAAWDIAHPFETVMPSSHLSNLHFPLSVLFSQRLHIIYSHGEEGCLQIWRYALWLWSVHGRFHPLWRSDVRKQQHKLHWRRNGWEGNKDPEVSLQPQQ